MPSELRSAHAEGPTWASYSASGKSLVTAGFDGDVRVYEDFDDADPRSFRAGKQVFAMAVKKGCIATALETNAVQLYTFQGQADGLGARFESSCYSVVFSHSGLQLAAGGSEFTIKVPTVASPSQTKVLRGHKAPVLSLAFDASDEYLASASCDGSVRVWKIAEEKSVHSEDLLEKGNDLGAVQSICGLSWQPKSGGMLAIPVKNGVQLVEHGTWAKVFVLECPGDDQVVNIVAWSVCGKYLAVATINGDIFLFNVAKKVVIEDLANPSSICCLQFHPKGEREIVYADMQGQLGKWEYLPVIDDDMADEDLAAMVMDVDDIAEATGASPNMADEGSNLSAPSIATPSSKRAMSRASFLDDSASESGGGSGDEDEDGVDEDAAAALADADMIDDGNNLGEWPEEDLDAVQPFAQPMGAQERLLAQTMNASAQLKEQRKAMKSTVAKQQPSFQVGSTPSKQHTYYMAYNDVGMVRCKHEEADMTMLDVEFHDTSTHHSMHLSNTADYSLGALSEQAVAFACTASAEGKNKLECRHFAAWDGAKEWSTVMNKKESIETLAVSSSVVAVTTNRQLLRVWTLSGVQSFIATLPGPTVTMAAHRDLLAVAYHHAIGGPHSQCISCQVYQCKNGNMTSLYTVPVPVAPKTTLVWLGFSSCGFLCAADSGGLLHMLLCRPSPTWLPVSDLRATLKTKEDRYWVVGVDDETRQTKCIHCKDTSYPPCNPRPVIALLDFSPPVCELTTEKAQLELDYLRLHCTSASADCNPVYPADDESVDAGRREEAAALMKLFALACKTDRESRALDICRLLPSEHTMSLAQRYASRVHRISLAQRIDDLMDDKAREAELEEDAKLVAGFDSQYSNAGTYATAPGSSSSRDTSYNRHPAPLTSLSTTSSMSHSSASSSSSMATVGLPRLQPRAQLAERHRQHHKAVASANRTVANANRTSTAPTAGASGVGRPADNEDILDDDVVGAENPDLNDVVDDEEEEDEWAAADGSDEEDTKLATTPRAKPAGKKYGGLATSNPFQLSGTSTSSSSAPQPTTPSQRGGSYLDRLSSTTPVTAKKRKSESSPMAAGKPLKEKNGNHSSSGKQKQVQASLLSSMTGKPKSTGPGAASNVGTAATSEPSTKGKRGRPKKSLKKSEEGGFALWLCGHEDELKAENPHMAAAALREEAVSRWSSVSADDKENFVAEAKTAAKAKAGAVFRRQTTSLSTVQSVVGTATDSLEDNIVENSLDGTPARYGDRDDDDDGDITSAIGIHDDRTRLSPPKRSRGARFIDSDDDDGNGSNHGTDGSALPAKRAKLAEGSMSSIVAESTKASVQKLAGFAFAK